MPCCAQAWLVTIQSPTKPSFSFLVCAIAFQSRALISDLIYPRLLVEEAIKRNPSTFYSRWCCVSKDARDYQRLSQLSALTFLAMKNRKVDTMWAQLYTLALCSNTNQCRCQYRWQSACRLGFSATLTKKCVATKIGRAISKRYITIELAP